ncbi:MAG: flagellar filament outer layer protein FlaA [Spirochaetota bacterium]
MKKIIYGCMSLLLCCSIGILYAQDEKSKEAQKVLEQEKQLSDQVYKEVTIEDFETTDYTNKNISLRVVKDEQAGISIRTDYPAPVPNSKRYLGVKVFAKSGSVLTILPAKPLTIDKYCKYINMWVYGKNFSGELSILIKDANGNIKRLIMGKLNFLGWRKLSVPITDEIAQEDKYLAQKRNIEIVKILYNPSTLERIPAWNYFYIDDITAIVREKYIDRQSDEW